MGGVDQGTIPEGEWVFRRVARDGDGCHRIKLMTAGRSATR